jgi:hypothetical protein
VTATRPQRYDQCDDDCTVDCGHCKGKGRLEPLTALRDRLIRDQAVLMDRKVAAYHANDTTREAHLDGQITGLALALRYIAEEAAR